MKYRDLLNRVIACFNKNGRDFPKNLFYPIPVYDATVGVMDQFLVCNVIRERKTGNIQKIEGPTDIYFNSVLDNTGYFAVSIEELPSFNLRSIDVPKNTSIDEFPEIYMKVRDFAFSRELSAEQTELLAKLVAVYDSLFEDEVKLIYHKFNASFFDWAYDVLS